MGRVAAIDIGSNSLKLAVGEGGRDGFTMVHEDRVRVRLGVDVQRTGAISPELIGKSIEAVACFRKDSERHEAEEIVAVATAALRAASNKDEFTQAVEDATGIRVEVIPPLEEARLIGVSADAYFSGQASSVLNIDVGGGSTEISLFERGSAKQLFSMPVGAVTLTEKCIASDPPSHSDLESVVKEIFNALQEPVRGLQGESWEIASATSGTSMHLVSLLNFEPVAEAPVIEMEKLSALSRMLTRLTLEERAKLPGISTHRAEVLVAGAYILEGVMAALDIGILKPCGYSLREGVAIDYLRGRVDGRQ